MHTPPTFVIDYPEARRVMDFLGSSRAIPCAGIFEPIGARLAATRSVDRALASGPFIVINGSGNYHHETVPLLESLIAMRGASSVPLLYLQIDAHPDTGRMFHWSTNCGSFVGRVLENAGVEQVYLLGLYPPCIAEPDGQPPAVDYIDYFRCDYFRKLRQYHLEASEFPTFHGPRSKAMLADAKRNPSVRRARSSCVRSGPAANGLWIDWRTLEDFHPAALGRCAVYLSIDLDVARDRPITDWRRGTGPADRGYPDNQGNMEWTVLLALIASIGASLEIVGADVCGLLEGCDQLSPAELGDSLSAVAEIYDALVLAMAPKLV